MMPLLLPVMKKFATLFLLLSVVLCGHAADNATKPKLKVAADGFPSGHDTPEGAACDLARAFIKRDHSLFTNICIRPYAGGKGPTNYVAFLKSTVESMKAEAERKEKPLRGPKSIGKVFAARHLSKRGPASYGYAVFDFQEVMFVDIGVFLHGEDDQRMMNRTMVIKDNNGKWYVHPLPSASPLLSWGLNEEEESERDFSDAYDVQK
jgi:hypothetical protein